MSGELRPITVTEPHLPPLEEFVPYLERIWSSRWLTNGGPMHQQLETALAAHLGVGQLALFNNATNGLLTALQLVKELRGASRGAEVITTPYSFAATTHTIEWANLTPVFVDVDPQTFNIDASLIEAAITPRTVAILPVHCYGYPCAVDLIAKVASRHSLSVVYDAAHAFGVRLNGESLLKYGDLSVLSFHATKVFNTFEGGAIVCPDPASKRRIDQLKNFGIVNDDTIDAAGLNGKMNEVQAAFGLLQLQYIDAAIARRRQVDRAYREQLADIPGILVGQVPAGVEHNASYFPVLVQPGLPLSRDALWARLQERKILARRYFYPLLSALPMYRDRPSAAPSNLPHASRLAQQVLCLPIHSGLSDNHVERVVEAIKDCLVRT
ncbi:MAG: DegT/DnrJ/EryC1/StrS family aminotransferase [Pseudomonadota bacterium]|nr:DegT/DnrJ/EryC1/StrS family aminotransferase [Pseudomonadota bacterium]